METFRYSAIDTAHKCLTKYKLQYLDGVQSGGAPSIDLEFGTALHASLNACLEGDDGVAIFNMYWDTLKDKQMVQSRFDWASLASLGEVFVGRFKKLHAPHFKPTLMEQKLVGDIGGYAIEGTPDFVGEYKGVMSVVDFKTSNQAYHREKAIVNEQMPIYAHLAKQVLGVEAKQLVYIVFIKPERRIQVIVQELHKNLFDAAIRNAILMCADLKQRKEFPKNPNSCMMGAYKCGFFAKCHGG